jgi:light-regulated signal transduction histidine kinase (bacteriophytochrome)
MKVLVIEDNPDHFEIIDDTFREINEIRSDLVSATTLAAGLAQLSETHFDICFCDLNLPDSNIEQTVAWLSSQINSVPMVALTSLDSAVTAETLLNNGVQDYLAKSELSPTLLYKTCRYAIERWRHQQTVADYNQNMQAFCASLSHDFNGHINRIMGVAKGLQKDLEDRINLTPNELQLFAFMQSSTSGIQQLVSDLQKYLSVSYQTQHSENVNLVSVLDKVVESLNNTLTTSFVVNIPKDLPIIQGNTSLLHVLFHNLISNSIKFNDNLPIIDISYKQKEGSVEVQLKDNGLGFEQIHAARIFSPFCRLTNSKNISGSGLGLSVVKRITELHLASIRVESEPGKGSSFILKFNHA